MATKTERILSYLPGTFRRAPQRSALAAVVDAFGAELLQGENSLAAIMAAHWVDHADRGAAEIDDLACLAALYGLAPRTGETVEEFRRHLKRYVRTFLGGTVTVQGILRVTAEALGLQIADDYADIDSWWTRTSDELVTTEARGDDAAELVLGSRSATTLGEPTRPARVTGTVDLRKGVDLRQATTLRLAIDNSDPVAIDLAVGAADPTVVTLTEIVEALKQAGVTAEQHDGSLSIAAPTQGLSSRLEVLDGSDDAAEAVLGLSPHRYAGSPATCAIVRGTVDFSDGVDLDDKRYLRLLIDGVHLQEIDCTGAKPAQPSLDEIRDAINAAFADLSAPIASHDGRAITLNSPTSGSNSNIVFQPTAAQDATAYLFGLSSSFFSGQDERPARVTGGRDLSAGVDLRTQASIQLRIDDVSRTINCAGADPANTRPAEIVAAINRAFGFESPVASHNGRFVTLRSSTSGVAGSIVFETPATADATELIFGIGSRSFAGNNADRARLVASRDLSGGVDLRACHMLQLAVDDNPPVEIDLRNAAADPWATRLTLDDLVAAVNATLHASIATHDGAHLILASPTAGDASSLVVGPLVTTCRRRFVTRAMITEEASQAIFGFTHREATGTAAVSARVRGSVDLSRGIDLRTQRYLRLAVDQYSALDIDCAGKRPRASTLPEIVSAINTALGRQDAALDKVATHDGTHLILTSPSPGTSSRISFEAPRAADALDTLLGVDPQTVRGRPASGIMFVGTVDLSSGFELPPGAAIKLKIDAKEAVEIKLVPADEAAPVQFTLVKLMIAINSALGASIASHDGRYLTLALPPRSPEEQRVLTFEPADSSDASAELFGIKTPRTYSGVTASPAWIVSTHDLSSPLDLRVARYLRLAVDAGQITEVDCAAEAEDPATVTLQNVINAINSQLEAEVASEERGRLKLTSAGSGSAARITLEPYSEGDARRALLGTVAEVTMGIEAKPAVLTGKVDLLAPVDLSERHLLRIQVDDNQPVDIDVAGERPATTFLDEIVAAINDVVPGLAAATDDDRLELRAASSIAVLPLRYLELAEYPPRRVEATRQVRHGTRWRLLNDGAGAVYAEVNLHARQGAVGPTLVNRATGWQLRLLTHLPVGANVRLWHDPTTGLCTEMSMPGGTISMPVAAEKILVRSSEAEDWRSAHTHGPQAAEVLRLPVGVSHWQYLDCHASRFDSAGATFRKCKEEGAGRGPCVAACFAGLRPATSQIDQEGSPTTCGICRERGVFDVSRFAAQPPGEVLAVFATATPEAEPQLELTVGWDRHQPGAFCVNLPIDLPERFGGRFNQAYFGQTDSKPEQYPAAVSEPPDDEDYLVTLINQGKTGRDDEGNPDPSQDISPSNLVQADPVKTVPQGWEAVQMPFRQPRKLTLGSPTQNARLYLAEDGLAGYIKLEARAPGAWANAINVAARKAGPARYNVTISYAGSDFENARQVVLNGGPPGASSCRHARPRATAIQPAAADELPTLIRTLLQPGPVGVVHAKAAGIRAEVTRDRAYPDDCQKEKLS